MFICQIQLVSIHVLSSHCLQKYEYTPNPLFHCNNHLHLVTLHTTTKKFHTKYCYDTYKIFCNTTHSSLHLVPQLCSKVCFTHHTLSTHPQTTFVWPFYSFGRDTRCGSEELWIKLTDAVTESSW